MYRLIAEEDFFKLSMWHFYPFDKNVVCLKPVYFGSNNEAHNKCAESKYKTDNFQEHLPMSLSPNPKKALK